MKILKHGGGEFYRIDLVTIVFVNVFTVIVLCVRFDHYNRTHDHY